MSPLRYTLLFSHSSVQRSADHSCRLVGSSVVTQGLSQHIQLPVSFRCVKIRAFNYTSLRSQTCMVLKELFWSPYQLIPHHPRGKGGTVLAKQRNVKSVLVSVLWMSLPYAPMELISCLCCLALFCQWKGLVGDPSLWEAPGTQNGTRMPSTIMSVRP